MKDSFRVIGLHFLLETPHLGFHVMDLFERRKCRRMNSLRFAEINMLVKKPELQPVHLDDLALICALLTNDQSEDRSLAGAVSPDEAYFFIRIDLERDALEDLGPAI